MKKTPLNVSPFHFIYRYFSKVNSFLSRGTVINYFWRRLSFTKDLITINLARTGIRLRWTFIEGIYHLITWKINNIRSVSISVTLDNGELTNIMYISTTNDFLTEFPLNRFMVEFYKALRFSYSKNNCGFTNIVIIVISKN
jgi:hypothetical protein